MTGLPPFLSAKESYTIHYQSSPLPDRPRIVSVQERRTSIIVVSSRITLRTQGLYLTDDDRDCVLGS